MYHLYHTPAFVLGGTPFGEGSKFFILFTEELGMIRGSATSVRAERSKLRYGLQDFSLSEITLVRGREFWRITNATFQENIFTVFLAKPLVQAMFARVFRLLERLLAGEEKNEKLFDTIVGAFSFLKETDGNARTVSEVEIVLVLRVLYLLGYLAPQEEFADFLATPVLWNDFVLSKASILRALALSRINHSLSESQL